MNSLEDDYMKQADVLKSLAKQGISSQIHEKASKESRVLQKITMYSESNPTITSTNKTINPIMHTSPKISLMPTIH